MQKSKITSIIPQADKQWNDKVLRKRTVALEDGTAGNITLFPDNKEIEVGEEIEFEIEDKGYGVEIKLKKTGGAGGGFTKAKAWTSAQVAQQDAVKITAAALTGGLDVHDYKIFFAECKQFMIAQIEEEVEADKLPF